MTRSMAEGAAPPPACTLVIFGATGDLTHRLLMPALYNLGHWGLLPKDFSVIGVSRSEMSSEEFRRDLSETGTMKLLLRFLFFHGSPLLRLFLPLFLTLFFFPLFFPSRFGPPLLNPDPRAGDFPFLCFVGVLFFRS